MMTTRSYLFIAFLFCFGWSSAQNNDAGLWTSFSLSQDIAPKLDASLSAGLRFDNNFIGYDGFLLNGSVGYKLHDFLKVNVDYRLSNKAYDLGGTFFKQRFSLDLSSKVKWKDGGLGIRIRTQHEDKSLIDNEGLGAIGSEFRVRLKVEHKVYKKTVASFAGEYFTEQYDFNNWSAWRYTAGIERKIKKRQYLNLGYRIQRELSGYNPTTEYIIMIGYSKELKKRKPKKKEESQNSTN